MSKTNPTLKEVSARVDKLAELFEKGLESFKKEISPTFLSNEENSEFINRFNAFESSINTSLNELKKDVKNLNENCYILNWIENIFERIWCLKYCLEQ